MSSLSQRDVGARVIVRYRLYDGSAQATDVLGELLSLSDHSLQVCDQRSPHPVLTVALTDVVAAKRIPARRVTRRAVRSLEQAATGGWIAPETVWLSAPGGWLLRAADGFTRRANSCLPVGNPGCRLDEAVDEVITFYAARGLPACFQLPTLLGDPVAEHLDARGWPPASEETIVLTATVAELVGAAPVVEDRVLLADVPDDAWLGRHLAGGSAPSAAVLDVLRRGEVRFASVDVGGVRVAIARGALSVDAVGSVWLGVTAVEVDPAFRRQGMARELLVALARWAAERDADGVYLQVAESKSTALAASRALGFSEHHRYVYRNA